MREFKRNRPWQRFNAIIERPIIKKISPKVRARPGGCGGCGGRKVKK